MIKIVIFSVILVVVIFVMFAIAISKGYSYKHKIDPIEQNPHLNYQEDEKDK